QQRFVEAGDAVGGRGSRPFAGVQHYQRAVGVEALVAVVGSELPDRRQVDDEVQDGEGEERGHWPTDGWPSVCPVASRRATRARAGRGRVAEVAPIAPPNARQRRDCPPTFTPAGGAHVSR